MYLSKPTKINWSESKDVFWTQLSDADCSYKVQIVKNNSKNLTCKMRIKLNMPSECKWSPHLAYKACISVFLVLIHRNEGAQHIFWILIWFCSLIHWEKKTYCTCNVCLFDMEILEVIKFDNAIFIVTFYSKIILSNAHTWQHKYIFKLVPVKSVFRSYYILTRLI